MELTKENRKSIATAENISATINKKLNNVDKGIKKDVNLLGLAKDLAKRKIANLKEGK